MGARIEWLGDGAVGFRTFPLPNFESRTYAATPARSPAAARPMRFPMPWADVRSAADAKANMDALFALVNGTKCMCMQHSCTKTLSSWQTVLYTRTAATCGEVDSWIHDKIGSDYVMTLQRLSGSPSVPMLGVGLKLAWLEADGQIPKQEGAPPAANPPNPDDSGPCNSTYVPLAFYCALDPMSSHVGANRGWDCARRTLSGHLENLQGKCGVGADQMPPFNCEAHSVWALNCMQNDPNCHLKLDSPDVREYRELLKVKCGVDLGWLDASEQRQAVVEFFSHGGHAGTPCSVPAEIINRLQRAFGLPLTGVYDEATVAAIKTIYSRPDDVPGACSTPAPSGETQLPSSEMSLGGKAATVNLLFFGLIAAVVAGTYYLVAR